MYNAANLYIYMSLYKIYIIIITLMYEAASSRSRVSLPMIPVGRTSMIRLWDFSAVQRLISLRARSGRLYNICHSSYNWLSVNMCWICFICAYYRSNRIEHWKYLTRFNKIAIPNKFQMARGHWLIESPTIFSSTCSPPRKLSEC